MFVESASIADFSVVAVELSEEIRIEDICELAGRSPDQLAADVAKKTWEELQSTARTICNSLAQSATEGKRYFRNYFDKSSASKTFFLTFYRESYYYFLCIQTQYFSC